jgi:hypothetical protein
MKFIVPFSQFHQYIGGCQKSYERMPSLILHRAGRDMTCAKANFCQGEKHGVVAERRHFLPLTTLGIAINPLTVRDIIALNGMRISSCIIC